jgi:hypothetical protein
VFTAEEREAIRAELIAAAQADRRISGGAITGSAAAGTEDGWSDVDLAFGVADAKDLPDVLADRTAAMYADHGALHHFDVVAGAWIYRVFLLRSTLQVDLAFVPAMEFGPRAPTFRLVFGRAVERSPAPPAVAEQLVGLGWVYALHARSCLARGRLWQAAHMVGAMRDQVLALACLRHGLPTAEARGVDRLPPAVTSPLEGALVARIERDEIARAFRVAAAALLAEVRAVDEGLAARLDAALGEISAS